VTKKDRAYLENYKAEAEKLYVLSRFATRQLLGERPADDPRVDYMAGLEAFKNLANAQLSGIIHLLNELMGDKEFRSLQGRLGELLQRELSRQVKSMEEDLCVTDWKEGAPIFNLQALQERIKTWPTQ